MVASVTSQPATPSNTGTAGRVLRQRQHVHSLSHIPSYLVVKP
jgi:hypothetical protein